MNAPLKHPITAIRQVSATDKDAAARVEAYLEQLEGATPFHRPVWMAAVERACGHEALYLLAEDSGGAIRGLLPLHIVHSALFGRSLVSCGFAVDGGILAEDYGIAQVLGDAAWALAEQRVLSDVELRGGFMPAGDWLIKSDAHAGFIAPLADDDEAQLLAIPRKQRAEVRKGLANLLEIRIGNSSADRANHYAVYAESVRNLGTPVFPKALFDAVLDGFGDDADILTISSDGAPVASVLSLYHKGKVMPYWGGGTHAARRLRANDVMYYALMNHARSKGCDRFDFGRSKIGSGAYAFKKNWGFEPQPLSLPSARCRGQNRAISIR
ncbi:MAG: FemAB family XrtA/PEP-CTERM system-associated protein [Parasphingorhabdus sp.]|nr:FemAB family XrtA/PEP-CTERM system-associated protein [Parasphingorhabdus sp.]